MEPVATTFAVDMDSPAAEIQDFDTVVRLYWPRIFRFVLASLRDRDSCRCHRFVCLVVPSMAPSGGLRIARPGLRARAIATAADAIHGSS